MVALTIIIMQHLQQNCYCECDHFATVDVKWLNRLVVNTAITTAENFMLQNIISLKNIKTI